MANSFLANLECLIFWGGGAWTPLLVPPSSAFFSVSIHIRGRTFEGGGGDFEKKIPARLF